MYPKTGGGGGFITCDVYLSVASHIIHDLYK